MPDKCPICNSDATKSPEESYLNTQVTNYSCPRCGDYSIDDILEGYLTRLLNNDIQKIAVLSHWVRTKNESISAERRKRRERIILRSGENLVENIVRQPSPTPAEQADKFILWLGSSKHPRGQLVPVGPATHQSIMGSTTPEEFELVLYHLMDVGILKGIKTKTMRDLGTASLTLSFEGWQRFEELKQRAIDSRKAFMAMQYDDRILDRIVEETFKLAVKQTGFELFRLVERPKAGLIDDRLRVEIQTSRFLIADLTHENAGAYWEAGYAEGLGRPVIYTCEKAKFDEQKTHFDTNHHLTIPWDKEHPEEAAAKLKATIRATLPGEAKLTDE